MRSVRAGKRLSLGDVAPHPAEELAHVVGVAEAEVLLRREVVVSQKGGKVGSAGCATGMDQQRREVNIRELGGRNAETICQRHRDACRPQDVAHRLTSTQVAGERKGAEELRQPDLGHMQLALERWDEHPM